MRTALLIASIAVLMGGCASSGRDYGSFRAHLIPGYDDEIPSDWEVIGVSPDLLDGERWSRPFDDAADLW